MRKYYADKTGIGILFVMLFVLVIVLIAAALIFLSFIAIIMWIAIGVFSAAFLTVVLIWLPLYFKSLCYYVSSEEVIAHTGVFFKFKKIVKVSSIQYFTWVGTPFSSSTGINFLVLNVLGGNVILMFLSKKDVEQITKTISGEMCDKRRDDK